MQTGDRDDRFRLLREESAAAGMTRIAAGRAETALHRLQGITAGEGETAEAIHAARKDLKKVRTVLRLVRAELPKKAFARENRRFRDAGRALSTSRDAEVKLATLAGLRERVELPPQAAAIWEEILGRDRDAATSTLAEEAAVGEAISLIEAGLAAIGDWELKGDSWELIDKGVVRTYRRGRRAYRAAAKDPSEEAIHEWRKRAKDLWYELRLLGESWPGPMGVFADEAHTLADLLGDHHDLALLRTDLEQRNLGAEPTRALQNAIAARQQELVSAAVPLGARLYAERPQAFRRRLRGYWRAWRS